MKFISDRGLGRRSGPESNPVLCNPCASYFKAHSTLPDPEILAERKPTKKRKRTEPTKTKLSGPCSHCPAVGTYPTTNLHHLSFFAAHVLSFFYFRMGNWLDGVFLTRCCRDVPAVEMARRCDRDRRHPASSMSFMNRS